MRMECLRSGIAALQKQGAELNQINIEFQRQLHEGLGLQNDRLCKACTFKMQS